MTYTFDKEKHLHLLDGQVIPGITGVLKVFFPNPHWTEYGRDRGSYVHQATELYDLGNLDEESLDPVLVPYLAGWKLFRRETGFIPSLIEKPMAVISRRFATVIDRVGILTKKKTVLEIKGGAERTEHKLQTAGQSYICRENKINVLQRGAVYLPGDGTYKLRLHEDPMDENAFLSLVSALAVIQNYGGKNGNNH